MCEQQYFLEYVLGWRGPSGQKADKGTIVHKVLEILAVLKKCQQDKVLSFIDDIVGEIKCESYCVDDIIDKVYSYYSTKCSHHKWTAKDLKDCKEWSHKALNFNNGMFDPRNRSILSPEQHFDFTINKKWAEYDFDTPDGNIKGNLALKGTVDLITKIDDKTLEVIDWKTGKRLDWATGQEKTHEKLQKDPQLMIYHYAINHIFPEYEYIIFTIYFINDGGPFSVLFDKSHMSETEYMLKNKFEIIKRTKKPKLSKTWMCNKLCHFGKTTFENSCISPIIEYRDNQNCQKDTFMTKCEQVKHDIELYGINEVTNLYKHPNHAFGKYKAPGSAE